MHISQQTNQQPITGLDGTRYTRQPEKRAAKTGEQPLNVAQSRCIELTVVKSCKSNVQPVF